VQACFGCLTVPIGSILPGLFCVVGNGYFHTQPILAGDAMNALISM
jgi:hypothetical protein